MIRDIYLGMLVLLVAAGSVLHRTMPRSIEVADSTSATVESGESPSELTPPDAKPAEKSSALTTIFPDGYEASKGKSSKPKEPEKPIELPKPVQKKAAKEDEKIDAGPVLLVEEDGPSLPVMPMISGEEVAEKKEKPEAKQPEDDEEIVTEFVPFQEELPAPSSMKSDTKDTALETQEEPKSPKKDDLVSDLTPPNLFPPPGKPDSTPSSLEPPVLALPSDEGSDGTGSVQKTSPAPKSKDLPPAVFSFDRRVASSDSLEKDKSQAAPVGGNPVHPFFARYLERKTYYVREGDTLDSIAVKLYQDRTVADRLFEINQHQLKRSEQLRPGMLLRLP